LNPPADLRPAESPLTTAWRRLTASATALVGLLTAVSAITPNVPWRDDLLLSVAPGPLLSLGHVLAGIGGLALVGLSRSLAAGTRRAAAITAVALVVVALLHLAKGLDYEEATVALALAALLVVGRRSFTRGAIARPGLLAGGVAVSAAAAAYVVSLVGVLVHHPARETLASAVDLAWTGLQQDGWRLHAVLAVAVVAAAVFVRGLLRPEVSSDGHTAEEHERAAALVLAHGHDSLDPFMLREDKTFFFAHGGVLAYRVLRDTAVVSGDPVGPPGSAGPIVAGFLSLAHEHGWRVTMNGISPRHVEDYRRLGLRALRVGEEAYVDPRSFTLEGRRIRKVRQSVHRARRRGWVTEARVSAEVPAADWAQIVALEQEWQADQRRTYGFAMTLGRMGGAVEDRRMVYVLGRDPEGNIRALLRFLPYGSGLSLDAMRRSQDAPNGLTEALVVHALEHARAAGAHEVSLNFAGFGHIMAEGRELNAPQRLARLALGTVHSRFQLERLWAFNQKFEPAWRPRYLVYGSRSQLPRSALRVLQAESYLRPPRCRERTARWSPPHPAVGR
jgi:lysyl-tRNA synthetase, class II